ncbi:MAG: hypothetical protein WBG37_19965 [Desulfobacterales bacterium]
MTQVEVTRMDKFSVTLYAQTVFGIMGHPRRFFRELPKSINITYPLGFLILSAVFFTIASQIATHLQNFLVVGSIYLLNAVGMVFILTGLAFVVMRLSIGNTADFVSLFSIYALCSGVTLLVSWVPHSALLTEPWKWYLIGTGMIQVCGLKLKEALLIITLSLGIWYLFFRAIIALIIR